MKLVFFLPWWCCFCGCTLGTGFLYQFPASALQHNYPEQSSGGSQSNGFTNRRHWCHYTVTRTVSCQVQNGSETVIQRVYQSCRWPGPCANLVSYRTLIRPTYKMSYRTVTALEWRCCPGFMGNNCEEGKSAGDLYVPFGGNLREGVKVMMDQLLLGGSSAHFQKYVFSSSVSLSINFHTKHRQSFSVAGPALVPNAHHSFPRSLKAEDKEGGNLRHQCRPRNLYFFITVP
uniref:Collagen type XXVI alpha 1 chain n=1 Tax=Sphenodon punctatus TaxID=8508 RepID=A0A8D0H3C9_SPHPU